MALVTVTERINPVAPPNNNPNPATMEPFGNVRRIFGLTPHNELCLIEPRFWAGWGGGDDARELRWADERASLGRLCAAVDSTLHGGGR